MGADQELLGIAAGERDRRSRGALEIITEVRVHERGVIGLVGRHAVEHAVGVVHGQVEGRGADEGAPAREPARSPLAPTR